MLVDDHEFHRFAHHPLTVDLHLHADADLNAGREEEANVVMHRRLFIREDDLGRSVELDSDLGGGDGEILAGADVDRNPLPTPVIDKDADCRKCLRRAVGGNSRLLEVPLELTPHDIVGGDRADGAEELYLFVAHALLVRPEGRFHAEKSNHLHEVVLDHIAKATCGVIEGAASIHAEGLGHGDLDIADVLTVPDWLEEGIGKPRVEHVLGRLLAEIVVDAEDLLLIENLVKDTVEGLG